ncbi:type I restriction-modification system subunit M [Pseudomonas aeruginosa]|uniref:type I restriction-modification system subunit M n=1 Tax=Pseudomonas aeruginosa TaxID=287 RepID=UPI001CBDFA07|nr:class I SAM-dependent DNA methyltransferase [Pseudomonas aeruginosa]MCS9380711.1 type I restriction-modification system subunit M [Pseudomonas aeruginosa]MDP5953786.1 class I SAM-dependent DNA methyltransferase [Pseudomonas aeruginosa]MDP5959195.1 class I SAM-dependent DNA methyltransferase [Pseudomonas aeruginosa]HBP6284212.1 SAM-dependent DNA methyltransferase [Pseudomonas aeruginosa]HCL4343099.1 SAM-dependent DNA methyltransferase [Pseudomonas aeruginosa]
MNQQNLADFIWNVADVLRGDFKQSIYGRIILPFTLLRRLECVLEPTRDKVRSQYESMKASGVDMDLILPTTAGATFYNVSQFSLGSVGSTSTRANLEDYVAKFSANARQVFEHFAFSDWLVQLDKANLLYLVTQKFASIDLHPETISNHEMGLVFEHLIRKFAESANDTAGEFFTPRDVVRLATTLVFAPDHQALNGEGVVRTVYDCAAGTGGFLSSAIEQVAEWNPNARLVPYAQELNPETYAISVADKLIQGFETRNIKLGNTLSNDQLPHEQFDYCLANPPFGVKWEKVQKQVQDEHSQQGYAGRFGAGTPRVGDGSLLFLMHLLSKRKPVELGGSRIGIVLSGSPLFNGGAGSGESEIRRWILENDWLEAIIALPTDLFYNTGIGTYIWVLSNHKDALRKGKVQLIDASAMHAPMRKSLGSKRKYLSDEQIVEIAKLHEAFEEGPNSKIFATTDFGYRRITVERPLRLRFSVTPDKLAVYRDTKGADQVEAFAAVQGEFDNLPAFLKAAGIKKLGKGAQKAALTCFGERDANAQPVLDDKGNQQADADLREFENVPLSQNIDDYFAREVLPHVPDAWIDTGKTDAKDGQIGIVGYEINFNRYFYVYQPPRPLAEIDADLKAVEAEIAALLGEVTA